MYTSGLADNEEELEDNFSIILYPFQVAISVYDVNVAFGVSEVRSCYHKSVIQLRTMVKIDWQI